MAPQRRRKRCLTPGCNNLAAAGCRGLCHTCYRHFRHAVNRGASEAALIKAGRVLPVAKKGPAKPSAWEKANATRTTARRGVRKKSRK